MAELRSLSYKVFLTFLICGLFCFYAFMFFLSPKEHEDKFSSLGTGNRIATVLAYVSHYLKINMLHLRKMFFQSVTKASRRKK